VWDPAAPGARTRYSPAPSDRAPGGTVVCLGSRVGLVCLATVAHVPRRREKLMRRVRRIKKRPSSGKTRRSKQAKARRIKAIHDALLARTPVTEHP